MSADKIWRIIYTKVYREEQFFKNNTPREYRSLRELLESPNPGVYLVSGIFHSFDKDELERMARILPWYIHRLVKFPWVFLYKRSGTTRHFELVKPDTWAARALHYILRGSLAGELWEIRDIEMHKLLSLFKTLIMVSIVYNLNGESGASEPWIR